MLCKECGAQIPDDAKECEFCGAKTGDYASDSNEETKVINTAELEKAAEEKKEPVSEKEEIFDDNEKRRQEQMKKMLEDKKQQLSEIERRRGQKRKKQRRNRIMLICAICALAAAAAGVGIYYVAQNIDSGTDAQQTPAPVISTPLPSASLMPTTAPTPELSMATPLPEGENASAQSEGQTWTATGGSGSSGSSGSSGGSSSGSSSSGQSSSGGNRRPSSGGSSSGGSSSGGTTSSSGGASSGTTQTASVSNSGVSSSKISSQLSTGGEVIYNTGTGRYLMTFISGNTRYYANVSPGSTTAQVKNKPYTITAEPTAETYNGNTVYEITTLTKYEGDYILPTSGTKLLTAADIKGMSKYDLSLARNEIYARHGRKFQTKVYSDYFSSKSWYQINPNYNYSDDDSNLNSIEIKNVQFILSAER